MATSSLQDQAVLDQLFQQSMSPINTYSQGLLGLALQRRQEQQQLAVQQQRNLLELQLEKQRQAAANQGLMDRLKLEHDFKTADEKEKDRVAEVKLANQYDANLPLDTDYATALRFVTKAHGDSLISLNKRAGDAIRRITQGSGMTGEQFAKRLANEIASSPEISKVLTPAQREDLRAHPGKVNEIRAGLAKSPKQYEAFQTAEKSAMETVMARMTAENSTKPDVVAATGELKMIYGAMEEEQKRGPVSPDVWEKTRQAFHDAVYPPQPPQPAEPELPPPRLKASTGSPTTATPRSSVFRDWYYGLNQGGVPGAGIPTTSVNVPQASVAPPVGTVALPQPGGPQALIAQQLQSGNFPVLSDPSSPAIYPGTQMPIDPSILATLRLRTTLQDAATNQTGMFPTAFPLLPVPNR